MPCKRCIEQGKPAHFGSSVECAFESGIFNSINWNCATLNQLRWLMVDRYMQEDEGPAARIYGYDESCGVIRCSEDERGFIVLAWYKNRGCTSSAVHMGDDKFPIPLTLKIAEDTLDSFMK